MLVFVSVCIVFANAAMKSLQKGTVRDACAYLRSGKDGYVVPEWCDEYNLGKEYSPSCNIAPTDITPVLTSASNFGAGESDERIIKPMMWGMVPRWQKDSYKNHGVSTNNCRIETIASSTLYSNPLFKGNRCIILAEGFYEWQTSNGSKQPYYNFAPQEGTGKMHDMSTFENTFNCAEGWIGINILKMAGVYDEWTCDEGVLYSYSVITMESNSHFNWLHHRMPAILHTDEEIADWLDVIEISHSKAVASLKPSNKISWYPVSTLVNSSREKSRNCKKPIDPSDVIQPVVKTLKAAGSRSIMENWLKSNKRLDEPDVKRSKNNIDL